MKSKPDPRPLDEVMAEYDADIIEQQEADQRAYDALPQWQKDALKEMNDE